MLKYLVCVLKRKFTDCKLVITIFKPVQIKYYDFMEEMIVLHVQGKDCVLRMINEKF